MTRFDKAKNAVAEYTGRTDVNAMRAVEDLEHPEVPLAVIFSDQIVAGSLFGFLVHEPYTAETVEEVRFTSWPPSRSGRRTGGLAES